MTPGESDPNRELNVRKMRVIWRDTFIIDNPGDPTTRQDFLVACRAYLRGLACFTADTWEDAKGQQPEILRVIDRVSRSVASGGHDDLLRVIFEPMRLTDLTPTLRKWRRSPSDLQPDQVTQAVADADADESWFTITPVLVLHRAGVGIMEYSVMVTPPRVKSAPRHVKALAGEKLSGSSVKAVSDAPQASAKDYYTTREAIDVVRMGIQPQLMDLGSGWRAFLPDDPKAWRFHCVLAVDDNRCTAVAGLREFSQLMAERLASVMAEQPRRRRRKRAPEIAPQMPRPTGSTTVVLLETDPQPGADVNAFVREYAYPLRGIGAMDSYYTERARSLVERELTDDYSTDAESAVYLLGNSELMVFNNQLSDIVTATRKRLHFSSDEVAATYIYKHYVVLVEWVYLQEAILRSYIQKLDALSSAPRLSRKNMIATLHGALADLIQYQENITAFSTRVEFLERARAFHKLDQLVQRFERKQDLLLTYSSEFHDFREARAAEFLNWLAAILTGGELGNLIVNATGITPDENTALYLSVTMGSIAVAILVMLGLRMTRRR